MTLIGDIYRLLSSRFVLKPTNFRWVVENRVAGSGLPVRFTQFKWLLDHGIMSIITVREVPLPSPWLDLKNLDNNDMHINYLHLKVEDYKAPSLKDIDAAVRFIENETKNERSVLVHCAAGKGRTGTILAAYIMKNDNLMPVEAIRKIRKLRPGSIQTESQEKSVYAYKSYIKE